MKVAFHFDENAKEFKGVAFFKIAKVLFPILAQLPAPRVNAELRLGTLLLTRFAHDVTEVTADGHTEEFNKEKFVEAVNDWMNPPAGLFSTLGDKAGQKAVRGEVYAACLSSIDPSHAALIDNAFKRHKWYLGAVEVDDLYPSHLMLYAHGLIPFGRLYARDFYLFFDSLNGDDIRAYSTRS